MTDAKDPKLALFELYLATAEKLSDRRAQANSWMLSVNSAIVGLYGYPPDVFDIIDGLAPSNRGELEITDVNRAYAQQGRLRVERVEGWWHDGGKHWADLADVGRLIEETGANK